MATLFDLAQQYLNRALPETFRYAPRTPPPVTVPPQDPNAPTARILPMPSGGGDGFSVYNPDPNRTRTSDQYSPYNYRKAAERNLIGTMGGALTGTQIPNTSTEVAKLMDMYPDYYQGKQLTGIPGAIQNYAKNSFLGKGLDALANALPVNRTGILQNELLGAGFQLNDIGQIVSDGGNINTAQNIMAGYNAAKVDADTFAKRRAVIEKNMKDPVQKAAKLKALAEAEAIMLGTAKDRADMITEQKLIEKDPSLKGPGYLEDAFDFTTEEDDESETPSFIIDNNIIGPGKGINTFPGMGTITPMGPTYGGLDSIGSGGGITFAPTAPITSGNILANKNINKIEDYINISGGKDNDGPITTAPKKTSQGLTTSQFQAFKGSSKTPSFGTGSGGLGDYQIQPSKPTKSLKTTKPGTGGGADSGNNSCFLPDTLVKMVDGSTKKIIDVDIGDEFAEGGSVFAVGRFLNTELYDNKAIEVSGSHMVSENGTWMRVRDSEHGKLLGNEEHTVYVFGSENRRILINDILFTDYFEVNEQDKLMNNEEDFFDNWKLYAKQDSGNNVDIINAS